MFYRIHRGGQITEISQSFTYWIFHSGDERSFMEIMPKERQISWRQSMCTAQQKSHRGQQDKEIIRFGADESHIKMMVRRDGIPYRIDMHLKKNRQRGSR